MNIFMDSVRHYTTIVQGRGKWDVFANDVNEMSLSATGGRSNGPCVQFGYAYSGPHAQKAVPSLATVIAGARVSWTSVSPLTSTSVGLQNVLGFWDGTTYLCGVFFDNAGILRVSNNTAVLGSESGASFAASNTLKMVEAKVTIHPTAGSIVVRVAGVTVISLTNVNTRGAGANNYCNYVKYGTNSNSGGPGYRMCDFYINDTTGADNNDFAGDVQIDYFPAAAAGTVQQSTVAGTTPASTRVASVSETTPNDDVTRVDLVTGQQDTYTLTPSLPVTNNIKAVQIIARVATDVSGTNGNRLGIKTAAGTAESAADLPAAPTWAYLRQIIERDASASTITAAAINAAEVSFRKTA